MTLPITLLLGIIVFTFTAFVLEWLPIDVVALTSLGLLLLAGLVTPEEAIAGFSNPAVVTVMMMFILSGALVESGLVRRMSQWVVRYAGESKGRGAGMLLGLVAVLSAFINNTAAVAVMMPVAIHLARHFRFSPSKILLPLSYVSIFGGTCTLIGTSTNLLVSSMAENRGQPPFSVFEFFGVGMVLLVVGALYMAVFGERLLPARASASSLTSKYHLSAFLTEIRVPAGSSLVGRTVVDEHVRERFELNVLEILRGKKKIATDLRNTALREGDVMIVRGAVQSIISFKEQYGLLLLSEVKLKDSDLSDANNILMEMQLSPASQHEGKTLKEIDFRRRYGCFVLALNRRFGGTITTKLAHIPLERYDTLLVLGPRNRVEALQDLEDFVPLEELEIRIGLTKGWWLTALTFPVVILLAAVGGMSILKAAILGVVVLLVTRRLSIQQAYKSVSWTVIFLLAAILPLGTALENTKGASGESVADMLGAAIASLGGPYGPLAVLAVMVLVTALMTEIISNNAAAVLMVPIAISSATVLDVSAKPMLMGVAFAASAAFLTPMGYQTNTMVYGPGDYRFRDYLRLGAPLKLLFWLLTTLLVPMVWSF